MELTCSEADTGGFSLDIGVVIKMVGFNGYNLK